MALSDSNPSTVHDVGDNILVPKPGFPLYQVITQSLGGSVKQYPLIPEKSWSCDIEAMDKLIDSKTKIIVISNPSNPCGSNFTAEHLKEICAVARKHNLPILADEIYAGLVFTGEFAPLHVHSGDVPVISVGGKRSLLVATAPNKA
jgi:tyrosine aminotransferase